MNLRGGWKRAASRLMALVVPAALLVGAMSASAAVQKKLYFEETQGILSYTPVRDGNENWFMSFRSMVPGVTYHDELQIENHSKKNFDLYMQVVPREQEEILDKLLEEISMKVSYDGELLYSGKATGALYPGEVPDRNLQTVIPLGRYRAGDTGVIAVDVGLPGSMTLEQQKEYNDKLTRIDWKFMVTEYKEPGGGGSHGGGGGGNHGGGGWTPSGGGPGVTGEEATPSVPLVPGDTPPLEYVNPKTGDSLPVHTLTLLIVGSGLVLAVCGFLLARDRKSGKKDVR